MTLDTPLPHPPRVSILKLLSEHDCMTISQSHKIRRALSSLKWRSQYANADTYHVRFDDGFTLSLRQRRCGELDGIGTGASVWPAATALIKFLEVEDARREGLLLKGKSCIDVGCGTGAVGLAASYLGAQRTVLSDQQSILFLANENWEALRLAQPKMLPNVEVREYDWGEDAALLGAPFDLVLVSDCVLPKLYPIEPLVEAIDKLSGPNTVVLMSYEHRFYPSFDPRQRFKTLMESRGFIFEVVPEVDQHPHYVVDDIEIWRLQRACSSPLPGADHVE